MQKLPAKMVATAIAVAALAVLATARDLPAGVLFAQLGETLGLTAPEGFVSPATANAAAAIDVRFSSLERGALRSAVTATGTLAPVALVSVSTQVSGQVADLFADFNATVSEGEIIARLDPLSFQTTVEHAQAEVGMAQAAVARAEVNLALSEAELERKGALASRGSGSTVEKAQAEANRSLAAAALDDARFALQRAQATLKQAQTDLARTVIRSPVDGVVIHRNVEVGQIVAASLQAPTLFTIAKDLRDMQVNAAVDEAEIGKIVSGQAVEFTVDAYPGRSFTGSVRQIRKAPQTTQNVVTYTVVVKAPNADLLLLPGMTANTRFIVDAREDVLSVPNAALRFRPDGGESARSASVLWVRGNTGLEAMAVRLGLNNGTRTEVIGEGLEEGLEIAVGRALARPSRGPERRLIGIFQ